MTPRFLLTCVKTGRFWNRGITSESMARRMAVNMGLKDYTVERITA